MDDIARFIFVLLLVVVLGVGIPMGCREQRLNREKHAAVHKDPLFAVGQRVRVILDERPGMVVKRRGSASGVGCKCRQGYEYRVRMAREHSNVSMDVAVGGAGLIGGGGAKTDGASPYVIVQFHEYELREGEKL